MYQERRLLYLYCETPLHAGSGSELGIVDLPIQRERHTKHPKVEASSLKGAMREHFMHLKLDGKPYADLNEQRTSMLSEEQRKVEQIFGPPPNEAGEHASCIAFTDARLLCMPVRSAAGVWTWITCPGVLSRFAQDLGQELPSIKVKTDSEGKTSYAAVSGKDSDITVGGTTKLIFEEYAFTKQPEDSITKIATLIADTVFPEDKGALYQKLKNNLCVLTDEDFAYFAENATEVITRVRISQATGTVERGALWTEEYLPSESILYSVVLASGEFKAKDDSSDRLKAPDVMSYITDTLAGKGSRFQLGGNATLGKGHLFAAFAKTKTPEPCRSPRCTRSRAGVPPTLTRPSKLATIKPEPKRRSTPTAARSSRCSSRSTVLCRPCSSRRRKSKISSATSKLRCCPGYAIPVAPCHNSRKP